MADILQIHDANFTSIFYQKVIKDKKDISDLRWPVFSSEKDVQSKAFGYIKAIPS